VEKQLEASGPMDGAHGEGAARGGPPAPGRGPTGTLLSKVAGDPDGGKRAHSESACKAGGADAAFGETCVALPLCPAVRCRSSNASAPSTRGDVGGGAVTAQLPGPGARPSSRPRRTSSAQSGPKSDRRTAREAAVGTWKAPAQLQLTDVAGPQLTDVEQPQVADVAQQSKQQPPTPQQVQTPPPGTVPAATAAVGRLSSPRTPAKLCGQAAPSPNPGGVAPRRDDILRFFKLRN